MSKVVTYCTADCKHNSGQGYYNVCKHPCKQNREPYAGIDRYYVEKCTLLESTTRSREVIEVERRTIPFNI